MTAQDRADMGAWMSRLISNLLLALLVPAAGWLLLTVQDITVSLAKLEVKQEQLSEKASEVASLVGEATDRWRREQAAVDTSQNEKLQAHQSWLNRLSVRMSRVEEFARESGFKPRPQEGSQ